MVFGVLAYASVKGGAKHRRYGRIFLWLMATVVGTALLGTIFFVDRPFLTIVAFQSGYFSFSGFRLARLKAVPLQRIDLWVAILVVVVLAAFFFRLQTATIYWNRGIVYYLLFYLVLIVGFDLFRYCWPSIISYQRWWLHDHIFKMTSAFTALVSAGVGTVLAAWEPWNQILPAMGGTVWLIFCLVYYTRTRKTGTVAG